RVGVRRIAARGQGRETRSQGRRQLSDEDHQADPRRAQGRVEHPRAQERRIPCRLGSVYRDDGTAGSDAGGSLQASELTMTASNRQLPASSLFSWELGAASWELGDRREPI